MAFSGQDSEIPIIPYGDFRKLVVKYYHDKIHQEVDMVVTKVRNDCWVANEVDWERSSYLKQAQHTIG